MPKVYIHNARPSLVTLAPRHVDGVVVPGARLLPGVNEVERATYEAHKDVSPVTHWFGPGGFLRLVDKPEPKATPAEAPPPPPPKAETTPGFVLEEGFEDGDGSVTETEEELPPIPVYTRQAANTKAPEAPHDAGEGTAQAAEDVGALSLLEAKELISSETDPEVLREWQGKEKRKRVLLALESRLRELEA